ncbi:MAG TPA: DMT family transporter [bacterium]|nr:DMT family transporter [bacterium]
MQPALSPARGFACALAAMLIWSTTAIQVKLLGMAAANLTALAALLAAISIGLWLLVTRQFALLHVPARDWKFLLIFGIGAALNSLTYFLAFANTSTANTLISHYTAPVMVLLLAPAFIRERVSWFALLPLALALWGMWLITGGGAVGGRDLAGIGYGVVSAFAYAVVMLAGRRIPATLHPMAIMFWQSVIVGACTLPLLETPVTFAPEVWFFLLTFPVCNVALAGVLFFRSFAALKAFTVSILGYVEPVGALLIAIPALGEHLTAPVISGGLLIVLSGILVIWYENRAAAVPVSAG